MDIGRAVRELTVSFASAEMLVLCYHSVRSRARFAAQMDVLAARGYHVVGIPELTAWLRGVRPLRTPAALLTFDGGYPDQVEHAVPALAAHGFSATFFPISGAVEGDETGTTRNELRALQAAGHTIGCHTHTHRRLPGVSDADLADEVTGSKHRLEDALGGPVTAFAYPDGTCDARVVAAVRRAGFDVAFTVDLGGIHRGDDPYRLRRVPILAAPGPHEFAAFLSGRRVLAGAILIGWKVRERLD